MSVSALYTSKVTVTEELADALLSASNDEVIFNGLDTSLTINSGSSVPATMHAAFQKTMTAGAATIDLRALTGTNGGAVDGNGLKVQIAKFRNKSTNANNITIAEGAVNGYPLLGTAFTIVIPPGAEATFYLKDQAADISATDKTIDITGTGSQILECEIVMG